MANKGMTIGVAAQKSGCAVTQIRYYEDIGLLPPAGRTPNGRRTYGWPDISRLQMLRRLRLMDFSIIKIREFVRTVDAPTPSCEGVRDLAREHLDSVRQRKLDLEALEHTLSALVQECDALCDGAVDPGCPLVGSGAAAA